jgi:anti-sigma-K factor RskA
MTWDEANEMAPLYVIGGLNEKTAHELEASLHSATPKQRSVITQWRDVATLLPQALPLQVPPDSVKERLLNQIAGEAQQTPIEIAIEESSFQETARRDEGNISPFVQPRRGESKIARWMLIAATALLAFACGYLFKQNSDLSRERGELSKEAAVWKDQIDNIVSPRSRVISMIGEESPLANAKVVWDTKARQWAVYVFDLPAPPADKEYQLWYVTGTSKISAAVFRTDEQGRAVLKLAPPPEALTGLTATAVTLEPKGGSTQPTGKFYIKAVI